MTKQILNFNVDIKEQDAETRVISFRGSTGDIDRCNEVVEPKGWKLENYQKNPVFLWAHNYSSPPIGKAVRVKKSKDGLDFDIKFATAEEYPFADTIFRLYQGGFLKSVSVGFIPLEWEDHQIARENGSNTKKGPDRTITKQELLELSAVSVPANPNALMNALQCGLITDAEMKDFEYEAAREEVLSGVTAEQPEPEQKDACEIVEDIEPPIPPAPEAPEVITCSPVHETPVQLAKSEDYDRSKAFNRLITWSGSNDSLPDLKDTGMSELAAETKDCLLKLSTAFAYRDEHNLKYMHHDVEDGSLVTNLKGVTTSMKRLLEDVYHGNITIEDGKAPHKHLTDHYAEYKRIAPSFNLFRLEAIRELFADDETAQKQSPTLPEADDAIHEKDGENDADVLTAILNGLATTSDITENDLSDTADLLESITRGKKQ